jgi:3-phosphoshikimate 1-carboxyvinyltransferase
VKSCVLLAGLYASGPTAVEEKVPTRDHTEAALRHFGAVVRVKESWIEVLPEPRLLGRQLDIPGDLSGAAFFLVAAAVTPGSDLRIPRVGLNVRRRELLAYLQEAGLDISIDNEVECAGEPRGDLRIRYHEELMHRTLPAIREKRTAALIDEIPVLAVLGSQVSGGLEVSDARELRVKESDRIAAIAANLRALGARVDERPDGFRVYGGQKLRGGEVATCGDHRIAMAFAVAGLVARGETRVPDAECAAVSFPGFFDVLETIRVRP